jgi:hypothetical protein
LCVCVCVCVCVCARACMLCACDQQIGKNLNEHVCNSFVCLYERSSNKCVNLCDLPVIAAFSAPSLPGAMSGIGNQTKRSTRRK